MTCDDWKLDNAEDEYARELEDAPEPIDYREAAWVWMSADGSNDDSSMRADFAKHTLEYLADEAIYAWRDEQLDRDQFIGALERLRDELNQAGDKPGDVA